MIVDIFINFQPTKMAVLATDPPSANKRTIWPVVLVVLHGLCFVGGFCVAIPTSLSHVSGSDLSSIVQIDQIKQFENPRYKIKRYTIQYY